MSKPTVPGLWAHPEVLVPYDNQVLYHPAANSLPSWQFRLDPLIDNPPVVVDPNYYHQISIAQALNLAFHLPPLYPLNGISSNFQPSSTFPCNLTALNNQPTLGDSLILHEHQTLQVEKNENISVGDEEVIFVKEYKKDLHSEKDKNDIEGENAKSDEFKYASPKHRRNPVRKARSEVGNSFLKKEHLLEEDFAVLDVLEEENFVECLDKTGKQKNEGGEGVTEKKPPKGWPINVFERPEYNPLTNKIEPFDYTIREIQNKQVKKKSRVETCVKPKKSKKKYFTRIRKPKTSKPVEKVPVQELSDLVTTTFHMVGRFVRDNKENLQGGSNSNFNTLIGNQATLMALVNGNFDRKNMTEKVKSALKQS
ncbi:uncharacterized protein [Euwallacea fornicatus]|uniref:uncharacterized protein n=1 Tax=Euwallacea fornicatus TaxID=995702 RepID=UPI00338EB605